MYTHDLVKVMCCNIKGLISEHSAFPSVIVQVWQWGAWKHAPIYFQCLKGIMHLHPLIFYLYPQICIQTPISPMFVVSVVSTLVARTKSLSLLAFCPSSHQNSHSTPSPGSCTCFSWCKIAQPFNRHHMTYFKLCGQWPEGLLSHTHVPLLPHWLPWPKLPLVVLFVIVATKGWL